MFGSFRARANSPSHELGFCLNIVAGLEMSYQQQVVTEQVYSQQPMPVYQQQYQPQHVTTTTTQAYRPQQPQVVHVETRLQG